MERVTFTTDDGVVIAGAYARGAGGKAVLLLHMMPATKESWEPLIEPLSAAGLSVLAIDLRGHGESTRTEDGGMLDHRAFTDEAQQAKRKDVEAAARWLGERGAPLERLAIAGASIGANLAIDFAATHPDVPAVVALSPGLDYRGVTTEAAAARMPRAQKLLLVASAEDEYSFASAQALAKAKADAEFHQLTDAGHGTAMLLRAPGLFEFVASWIDVNLR